MATKNQSQKQWSDELNQEISSIKPELGTQQQERREPRFTYSTAEYDSYAKNGFNSPELVNRSDKFEIRFLNQVDLSKCKNGKIQVKILNMQRTRAIDYSSEKEEKREFLVYTTDWAAKNWLQNDIFCRSHIEGKHKELTKQLVTKADSETGKVIPFYVKGPVRTCHTLPFSKKLVDKILNDPTPFGADSENITDKDSVTFYGKFEGERGIQTMRCGDYTLEQFVIPEWSRFVELAVRKGGPASRIMNAEAEGYIK